MRKTAVLLWVLAGLALAWSCGEPSGHLPDSGPADGSAAGTDGGDGGGDGGAEGLPLDSACAVLNATRCAYLQECGLLPQGNDAKRDCELNLATLNCPPGGWRARVRQGTLRYDGEKAEDCAEALGERACAAWQQEPAVCSQLTSPAGLLGGVCYGGPEQECQTGVCTGGTCPRQCRERGDVGGVCEVDHDCKGGLYCRHTSTGGAVGTCAAFGINGDQCDPFRPCATGYYCGAFSTCTPLAKTGQACKPGGCEASAFCAYKTDGGTCTARFGEGDPCADDTQCASPLLCLSETGACAKVGPLSEGTPCSQRQVCADGLACVGTRVDPVKPPALGSCEVPSALGGPCASSLDCEVPLACTRGSDGGTCTQRLPDGNPCLEDRDCGLFSRCENASCVRIPRAGEPCPSGACLYGLCESTDGGLHCTGLGGPNAPCQQDDQCASGRCLAGACLAACVP